MQLMIDTIVLYANKSQFRILEPEKFKILGGGQKEGNHGYVVYKQNHTKEELRMGIYKPRLSLTKRYVGKEGIQDLLKIEMSLPKLLFGNNFQELRDTDYQEIKSTLFTKLLEMGVQILSIDDLEVSAIHYSKNIILTDYSTPYEYLQEIKKVDYTKALDMTKTDYSNEGYSFRIRCNSYEVIFYDKLKDLLQARKSQKKAIEPDSGIQLNLFDNEKKREPFEVLRMEVRLNKRDKIKRLFKELNIETELHFKNLFSKSISKKVLLYYLEKIKSNYPSVISLKLSNEKLLMRLISDYPEMKLRKILMVLGAKALFDEVGVRGFRELIKSFGKRKWYALRSELHNIVITSGENIFQKIEDTIREKGESLSFDIKKI